MADLRAAYVKTPAGLEEIRAHARQLTRQQRNLLILVDGRSELGTFTRSIGCAPQELCEHAGALVQQGLIALADGQVEAPQQAAASSQSLLALAQQIFGAKAGPVVHKLEKSTGDAPEQLMEAATAAAKLAKLTIDEQKAQQFLAEARRLLGG